MKNLILLLDNLGINHKDENDLLACCVLFADFINYEKQLERLLNYDESNVAQYVAYIVHLNNELPIEYDWVYEFTHEFDGNEKMEEACRKSFFKYIQNNFNIPQENTGYVM